MRNNHLRNVGRGFVAAASVILTLVASQTGCKQDTDPAAGGQGGAGGSGGGTPYDELTAREFYVEVVDPEIAPTCGICHQSDAGCVPDFMDKTAEGSYAKLSEHVGIVTHSDNSNLIYHGAHTGPALTEFQESLVRVWLDKELAGDEPPKPTLGEALVELGRCMKEQQFNDSQLYLLAYQQSEHGPCGSCHRTGEAGTWIGYNEEEMYLKNSLLPWIKRLVEPSYDENNRFVDLVPSNRYVEKVESANVCGGSHPAALIGVATEASITSYVDQSLTNWHNGNCEGL